jgi:hypothetical protein
LHEASHSADENERARKSLASRNANDKERIEQLTKQIAEFGACAEESDKRYDDVIYTFYLLCPYSLLIN